MDPYGVLDENECPEFRVIIREDNLVVHRIVPEEGVAAGDTDVCNPHIGIMPPPNLEGVPLAQTNHLVGLARRHPEHFQNDVMALCRPCDLKNLDFFPFLSHIIGKVNLAELALGHPKEIYG